MKGYEGGGSHTIIVCVASAGIDKGLLKVVDKVAHRGRPWLVPWASDDREWMRLLMDSVSVG